MKNQPSPLTDDGKNVLPRPQMPTVFRLNNDQRNAIQVLVADLLEKYGSVDNHSLRRLAVFYAMQLPLELILTVIEFTSNFGYHAYGALVIKNYYEVDQNQLGPTPNEWSKVDRNKILGYEIASLLLHGLMSSKFARFQYQREGKDYTHSMIPAVAEAAKQTGAGSKVELCIHFEDIPLKYPANWISFLYLRNFERATSQLASIRSIDLDKLSYYDKLWEPIFPAAIDENLKYHLRFRNQPAHLKSIFSGNPQYPFSTFDPIEQIPLATGIAKEALLELEEKFKEVIVEIIPESGDAILINNFLCAHGRGKFNAGWFEGKRVEARWMLRMMGWDSYITPAAVTHPENPDLSLELFI